ncbi:MAG: SDR family oxidoreductase [Bacilli bacterium]|nr:SDR family oxidoreductase [Bacilli bacterium]
MKALITGASSGIGKSIAIYLNELGYELILASSDELKLKAVAESIGSDVKYLVADLRNTKEIYDLYEKTKDEKIDILINNAGFGLFGDFVKTDLNRELEMIDVNIKAVHILTKLYLQDFVKRDSGYILNVASSAGFMAGPHLDTYYATKNYVLKLTLGIYEELRRSKSKVKISALCPGPVDTNFNKVARGYFKIKGADKDYVAKYAIDKMLKGQLIIIPTLKMKLTILFYRFVPTKLLLRITYEIQRRKSEK